MIKPILGFLDYFISDDGNVYSIRPEKRSGVRKPLKKLNPTVASHGYRTVKLCPSKKTFIVGHLVLLTFVGSRPKGMEMCHGPNGSLDDSLNNLSWGTKSQNQRDRIRDKTDLQGENHPLHKLTKQQVLKIRKNPKNLTQEQLAKFYRVGQDQISRIINRHRWKHLI